MIKTDFVDEFEMWRLQNDVAGCGYWASTLSPNEYSHAADLRRGRIAELRHCFVLLWRTKVLAVATDAFIPHRRVCLRDITFIARGFHGSHGGFLWHAESAEFAEDARAALVLTIRGVFSHPLRIKTPWENLSKVLKHTPRES